MRALLERSRPARLAAALCAAAAVTGLVGAASAQDDLGFRLDTLLPALGLAPTPAPAPAPAAVPARHRAPRRIWAAARSRPLRIAVGRRVRREAKRLRAPARLARARPAAEPQVIFPKLATLPVPPRPALVSIYQDRTLRSGDAVMMGDGVHVFRASGAWPHRPGDFVRLQFAAALGWQLRRTLDSYDRNPPTRWSSQGSWAG